MSNTRLPNEANAADKLMEVVVLPTPPFWFAKEMILLIYSLYYCFRFYFAAGIITVPTMIGTMTRTGSATKVMPLDDILVMLFPSLKTDDGVGGAPYADGAKAYQTR